MSEKTVEPEIPEIADHDPIEPPVDKVMTIDGEPEITEKTLTLQEPNQLFLVFMKSGEEGSFDPIGILAKDQLDQLKEQTAHQFKEQLGKGFIVPDHITPEKVKADTEKVFITMDLVGTTLGSIKVNANFKEQKED